MQEIIEDLACLYDCTVSAACWTEDKILKQDGNSEKFWRRTFAIIIQALLSITECCAALFLSVS